MTYPTRPDLQYVWIALEENDTIFSFIIKFLEKAPDQTSKDKLLSAAMSIINEMQKIEYKTTQEILQTAEPLKVML